MSNQDNENVKPVRPLPSLPNIVRKEGRGLPTRPNKVLGLPPKPTVESSPPFIPEIKENHHQEPNQSRLEERVESLEEENNLSRAKEHANTLKDIFDDLNSKSDNTITNENNYYFLDSPEASSKTDDSFWGENEKWDESDYELESNHESEHNDNIGLPYSRSPDNSEDQTIPVSSTEETSNPSFTGTIRNHWKLIGALCLVPVVGLTVNAVASTQSKPEASYMSPADIYPTEALSSLSPSPSTSPTPEQEVLEPGAIFSTSASMKLTDEKKFESNNYLMVGEEGDAKFAISSYGTIKEDGQKRIASDGEVLHAINYYHSGRAKISIGVNGEAKEISGLHNDGTLVISADKNAEIVIRATTNGITQEIDFKTATRMSEGIAEAWYSSPIGGVQQNKCRTSAGYGSSQRNQD